MKNDLKLVKIDTKYCDYLRLYDNKVPYNFENKALRPFVGVLFEVNSCKYFAPLSSPKPKHLKMKNTIDFLRLDDGKLGAINFNNMLPVMDNNVIVIDLNKKYIRKSDKIYQSLLRKQIYWLNRNDEMLYNRARKLYFNYVNGTLNKNVYDRCCSFKLLEDKCKDYNMLKVR